MKHFKELTGLRAIAAFMVYLHHYPFDFINSNSLVTRFTNELNIGVTIFFCLSGFLIYYRYFENFNFTFSFFKKYFLNRIARIYPLYFILTIITFIFFFNEPSNYSSKEKLIILFLNITFLRGFFDSFKFSGIIQGWSLTVEETYYFFAPLFFWFFRRKINWFILVGGCYLIAILLMLVVGRHDFYGLFRNFQFTFIFTFFGRCFEFFVGMWLAKQILKKPKLFKVVTFKNTLIGFTAITICIVLLSLVKLQYNTQQSIYHPLGLFVNNLLLPLGIIIFLKQ